MQVVSRTQTKKSIFFLVFLLSVSFVFAEIPTTKIVSPVAGTWANPQTLIVDSEPGTEVFYSFNEGDPLVSGFAYDGPVLIEATGNIKLTVISVSKEGKSVPKTVEYTVENKNQPEFVNVPAYSAIIPMYKDSSIEVPSDKLWYVGYSLDTVPEEKYFQRGGKIELLSNCDIVNYIPLIIKDGNSFYRYILKTGYSDLLRYSAPVPAITGIEFFSWNYILLNEGTKVRYQIDNGPWKETDTLISVDRSKGHKIKWQKLDKSTGIKEFLIPAKPKVQGMPERGYTNECVKLTLNSTDYQFGYKSPDGNILFTKEITCDTVTGDSASISIDFDVYYKGIKQGTVNSAFLIDRRNPCIPEIKSNTNKDFSRESVELTFVSSDEVYYSLSKPITSDYGFTLTEIASIEKTSEKSPFQPAINNKVLVNCIDEAAAFYTVYAYAKDASGNCSDITSYSFIIDSKNFYIDSSANPNLAHFGTKDDPFAVIDDAITSIRSNNISLYLKGNLTVDKPLYISTNCSIIGDDSTRLYFTSDSQLTFENANISIENCTFEKQVPQTGDVIQKSLLRIYDSSFIAKNCEFVCFFDFSGNCITAKNSSVILENTGLSIHASSYVAAVNAENSFLSFSSVRSSSSAKTAVGISASNNSCILNNSEIKVVGSYTRACEFLSVVWEFQNSTFISQNSLQEKSAIWMDSFPRKM